MMGGYVKADPRLAWIPVDLTLIGAALTVACIAAAMFRQKGRIPIPRSIGWVALLWIMFVPATLLPGVPLDMDKIGRLFTITLLAAVAPLFLIRSRADVRTFVTAFGLAGLVLALDALLRFGAMGGERFTASGGSTIALGRVAGIALLWVLALAITRRIRLALALLLVPLVAVALLGSGSRGPLLFAAMSAVLMVGLVNRKQATRLALFGSAGVFVAIQYWDRLPTAAIGRIVRLFAGGQDRSAITRVEAISRSWDLIQYNPLGIGWGGFAREVALWGSDARQYPHNIVVEVALEAGWFAAIVFIAYLVVSTRRAWTHPDKLYVLPLVSFVVLNAMVSGDVNDNRIMFGVIAIALASAGRTAPNQTEAPVASTQPVPSYQMG